MLRSDLSVAIAIVISILSITPTFAATPNKWVDPAAVDNPSNGANGGSANNPWSIGDAAQYAKAGDVVAFRSGVYTQALEPKNSGSSETQRIIFMADPDALPGTVILDDGCVNVDSKSHMKISGFVVRNCHQEIGGSGNGQAKYGIQVIGSHEFVSEDIWIEGNHIDDTNSSAIAVWGMKLGYDTLASGGIEPLVNSRFPDGNGIKNVHIIGNTITNAFKPRENVETGKNEVLVVANGVRDFEIAYNTVADSLTLDENGDATTNGAYAVDIKESVKNGKIHHNEIYNTIRGIYLDSSQWCNVRKECTTEDLDEGLPCIDAGDNLETYKNWTHCQLGHNLQADTNTIGFGHDLEDITIYNNVIHDVESAGIAITSEHDGGDQHRINVLNNLIYNTGGSCFSVYDHNPQNDPYTGRSTGEFHDFTVYNNTVFDCGQDHMPREKTGEYEPYHALGLDFASAHLYDLDVRNNIYSAIRLDPNRNDSSHNNQYNVDFNVAGSKVEEDGVTIGWNYDGFVDRANNDYRITDNSTAADIGPPSTYIGYAIQGDVVGNQRTISEGVVDAGALERVDDDNAFGVEIVDQNLVDTESFLGWMLSAKLHVKLPRYANPQMVDLIALPAGVYHPNKPIVAVQPVRGFGSGVFAYPEYGNAHGPAINLLPHIDHHTSTVDDPVRVSSPAENIWEYNVQFVGVENKIHIIGAAAALRGFPPIHSDFAFAIGD